MKIPTKKPHFFKPILPGFKDGLNIPIGFLKYLWGHEHIEHALLKNAGKKWLVKVKYGRRFKEGWKKFVEDHDLQSGDLLIFRHEGDMEFEVSIFDSTHCDREYLEYLQIEQEQKQEEEDDDDDDEEEEAYSTVEETSADFEFKEKRSPSIKLSDKASSHSEAAAHKPFSHSSFICNISPYCLTYGYLCIPKNVPFTNGLNTNKKYDLLIREEKQRSWNLKLHSCETQTFIGDGWRKFFADNCLKNGDRIMFEIVTDGEMPIWKFHVVTDAKLPMRKFQDLRANTSLQHEEKKPNLDANRVSAQGLVIETSYVTARKAQATAPTSANTNPHFVSTIKSFNISRSYLCVPIAFIKSNGLMDRREMILRDEKQRSWPVQLSQRSQRFAITRRLQQFMKANGVQVADTYEFELIDNRTMRVVHFPCKYDVKDVKHETSL